MIESINKLCCMVLVTFVISVSMAIILTFPLRHAVVTNEYMEYIDRVPFEYDQCAVSIVSKRLSPDGLFPGTYYFYDNMQPGSPSDPNGDGDASDSEYEWNGVFEYVVQSSGNTSVGYWYASSQSQYTGDLTSPEIDLTTVSGKDTKLTFWVSYNLESGCSVTFQISYNNGPFQTIETYEGDSTTVPGNLNGYIRRDIDISMGNGGTFRARWSYSGTLSFQESNPFVLYYLMAWSNDPPENTTVTISPSAPSSLDDLTVSAISTDPDGDIVQYTYEWYCNGIKIENLTNKTMVPSNMTDLDDVWRCVVTPYDGALYGSSNYDQVQIGNAPPTVPVVDIIPHEPTTLDDLECIITEPSTDPEGGNISYLYFWQKNGESVDFITGNRVDHNYTKKGETWTVFVKATDGNATSADAIASVVIGNTRPEPPTTLYPNITADRNPIISWYGARDVDSDRLWYRIWVGTWEDGDDIVSNAFLGERDYYKFTDLQPGTYYVKIICSDGMLESEYFYGTFTVVAQLDNSAPYPPLDVVPIETRDLEVNISWYGAYDIDGNNLTYYVSIGDNENATAIMDVTATTENKITACFPDYGTYYITLRSYDGVLYSAPHVSRLVISPNGDRPPKPPSRLQPTTTNLRMSNLTWEPSIDPDGMPVTYLIQIGTGPWYDDILTWRTTGYNNYYQLPVALSPRDYYVQIRAHDGYQYSEIYMEMLRIYNTPPTAPWNIKPDTTTVNPPRITWLPAKDNDGDDVSYYVCIGSSPGECDIVGWTYTHNTYFIPTSVLPNGTCYVSVVATDGYENSTMVTDTINITPEGNSPPVVDNIRPLYTSDRTPLITWVGWDPDTYPVNITYYISIGTYAYGTDIVDWTSTGYITRYQYNGKPLNYGIYHINIRAYDGIEDSQIVTSEMIVAEGNSPPYQVEYIYPVYFHDTTPTIWWSPSIDPDGDNVSYILKIGNSENTSDVIYMECEENMYNVSTPLPKHDLYITILATDGYTISKPRITKLVYMEDGYDDIYPPDKIYPTTASPGALELWWEYTNFTDWQPLANYKLFIGSSPFLDDVYSETHATAPYILIPYLPEGVFYVTLWTEVLSQASYPKVFTVTITSNAEPIPVAPDIEILLTGENVTVSFDAEEGYVYLISMGTYPTFADVMAWDSVNNGVYIIEAKALNLEPGESYYINIKVIRGAQTSKPRAFGFVYEPQGNGITPSPTMDDIRSKVYFTVYPKFVVVAGKHFNLTMNIYNLLAAITVEVKVHIDATGYTLDGNSIDYQIIDEHLLSRISMEIDGMNITQEDKIVLVPGAENSVRVNITVSPTWKLPTGNYTLIFTLAMVNGTKISSINITVEYTQKESEKDGTSSTGTDTGNEGGKSIGIDTRVMGIIVLIIVTTIAALAFYILNQRGKLGRKKGGRGDDSEEWIPIDEDDLFEI